MQRGNFARRTLEFWPSCESYTLVDVWKQQVRMGRSGKVGGWVQGSRVGGWTGGQWVG